jgi:hypothetical protein
MLMQFVCLGNFDMHITAIGKQYRYNGKNTSVWKDKLLNPVNISLPK